MISRILFSLIFLCTVQSQSSMPVIRGGFHEDLEIKISSVWGNERQQLAQYMESRSQYLGLLILTTTHARSLNGEGTYHFRIASDARKLAKFLINVAQIAPHSRFELLPKKHVYNSQDFEIRDIPPQNLPQALILLLRQNVLPQQIRAGTISFEAKVENSTFLLLSNLKEQGLQAVDPLTHQEARLASGSVFGFNISVDSSIEERAFTENLKSKFVQFKLIAETKTKSAKILVYRFISDELDLNQVRKKILSKIRRWKGVQQAEVSLQGRMNVTVPKPGVKLGTGPSSPDVLVESELSSQVMPNAVPEKRSCQKFFISRT